MHIYMYDTSVLLADTHKVHIHMQPNYVDYRIGYNNYSEQCITIHCSCTYMFMMLKRIDKLIVHVHGLFAIPMCTGLIAVQTPVTNYNNTSYDYRIACIF